MKRGALVIGALACLSVALAACDEEAPDKIIFGQACSLTGDWAIVTELTTQPIYTMWIEEINAKGGLYIEKYDKRIPVELIQYDDKSDEKRLKSLLEKLMLEDKVDFLLPPTGTTFLYEAAPALRWWRG